VILECLNKNDPSNDRVADFNLSPQPAESLKRVQRKSDRPELLHLTRFSDTNGVVRIMGSSPLAFIVRAAQLLLQDMLIVRAVRPFALAAW
jgi:hypothetical protein